MLKTYLQGMAEPIPVLTAPEVRVLGVLVEKALSTPEYYPLTRNALVAGCNQKSNREPVVAYTDEEAQAALDLLVRKRLVAEQTGMGSRTVKYRTLLGGVFEMTTAEKAVLAELMLRGPQTGGELRNRCTRMHAFGSVEEVEAVLHALAGRAAPLVAGLPGRREPRWAHLLGGPVEAHAEAGPTVAAPSTPVASLVAELDALRARVEALEADFTRFRSQFE
jgi:uncharacterized protein